MPLVYIGYQSLFIRARIQKTTKLIKILCPMHALYVNQMRLSASCHEPIYANLY